MPHDDKPRTMGALVLQHAALPDEGGTGQGLELLGLRGTTHFQAANCYLAALAVIRELQASAPSHERENEDCEPYMREPFRSALATDGSMLRDKAPLPPEVLVDAHQDKIETAQGRTRLARASRSNEQQINAATAPLDSTQSAHEQQRVTPSFADAVAAPSNARHKDCQSGMADVCKAAQADGIVCPAESCDIDDGLRKTPSTTEAKDETIGHWIARAEIAERKWDELERELAECHAEYAKDMATATEAIKEAERTASATRQNERIAVPVREVMWALEREAANTDDSPQWRAATALRQMTQWETRTLICSVGDQTLEVVSPTDGTGS